MISALSKQSSGRIDRTEIEQQPIGNLAAVAKSVVRQDIPTFETMMDTGEAERQLGWLGCCGFCYTGNSREPRFPDHRNLIALK